MSLNKVLNRPLFRKQALKKGALKPIKAQTGIMVGPPGIMVGPPVGMNAPQATSGFMAPAINQQGFYGRNIRPWVQRTKTGIAKLPGYGSRVIGDMKAFVTNPIQAIKQGRRGFGTASAIGTFGTYPLMAEVTRKLGMEAGIPKDVVDLLGAYGLTKNKYTLAAGLVYLGYRGARPAVAAVIDDVFNLPQGTTAADKNFMPGVEGALGKPFEFRSFEEVVKDNPQLQARAEGTVDESKVKIVSGRGAGDAATGIGRDELRAAKKGDDVLTAKDNETQIGNNEFVDLSKVTTNAYGGIGSDAVIAPPPPPAPVTEKITETVTDDGKKITATETAQQIFNQSRQGEGTEKPIGGKLYTTSLMERAKQIRSELGQDPQGDLARTTFLSSLASGLLTGTTRRQGLGGALEVLGQTLGPAVNNYAVMKLKQDELENKSMETYLGFALDEMRLFNEAAKGEPFDGRLGVIQFIDKTGKTKNVKGRETKAGTIEIATGQIGPRGNEIYASISSQGNVPGFGRVNQFLDKKTVDAETIKIGRTLSNRYKTFKITNDVLDIIAAKPKSVGPGGVVNLFKTRIGSAINDLGFSFGGSKKEAEAIADAYRTQIELSDLPEKTKKKLLESTEFDKIYNDAKDRIEKAAKDNNEKIDSDTLETLAVAETTLVYALANSFKDKDRLTARDVAAAEKLVNLFTVTRGSEAVAASIRAIGRQLQDDIIRYENDFRRVGGLERTLDSMKIQNQFRLTPDSTQLSDTFLKTLDREGLLGIYNKSGN